jgi:GntR family transcriptional regulator/MocR family aminotransferase
MSAARRLALLDWARRANAWVVEDDYDSEFRYAGRPLAALQGIDDHNRVVYIGTFSKVLFPALRLGYVVVPDSLVDVFVRARTFADGHSPTVTQAVVAEFLASGQFHRHVRRMRRLYADRQAALVRVARRELSGLLEVEPCDAGMHLIGWLGDDGDDREVALRAAAQGLVTTPLSSLAIRPTRRGGLVLGYTALNTRAIRDGVRKLACVLSGVRSASTLPT